MPSASVATPPSRHLSWEHPWGLEWTIEHVLAPAATPWAFCQEAPEGRLRLFGESDVVLAGIATSPQVAVLVAGDVYNANDLSRQLGGTDAAKDADVLLLAWEKWGQKFIERVEGPCAIVVLDLKDNRLYGYRDPMGCHSLFFAGTNNGFVLSDSLQHLRQHANVSSELNHLKLAERAINWYGQPHETFFQSIHRVPPGHVLKANSTGHSIESYFDLPSVRPPETYPFDEAHEQFHAQFERVVDRLHATGPTSILLSGGLDSISVAIMASEVSGLRSQKAPLALTLGFPDPRCDERSVQQSVAEALNLPQFALPFDESVGSRGLVSECLALTRGLSQPVSNMWRPAYLPLLRESAHQGRHTILTGIGGDEWLGASPYYMADLLKRGQLLAALNRLRGELRSFRLPRLAALRFQLWTAGMRPVLVQYGRPLATRLMPSAARWYWRRRQVIPDWIAPDPGIRRQLFERMEQEIDRQLQTRLPAGRYANYTRDMTASFVHPLVSGDREEDQELGRRIGARLAHPYWDAGLIQCLAELPPEWLDYDGYRKGLIRGRVSQRLAGLNLEKQKKVSAIGFSSGLLERELPRAWEHAGGTSSLTERGIIDVAQLPDETLRFSAASPYRQVQMWQLLSMNAWVAAIESSASPNPLP